MKQLAKVVMVDGRMMAEVVRSEACMQCRACDFGKKETVYAPLPDGYYEVGQTVELSLPDGSLAKHTLMVYGIPFVMLIAGLIVGALLTDQEWIQAVLAIATLGMGFLFLNRIDRRIRQKKAAAPCAETSETPSES